MSHVHSQTKFAESVSELANIEWDNILYRAKLAPMVTGACRHAGPWKNNAVYKYGLLYKVSSRLAEMVAKFQECSRRWYTFASSSHGPKPLYRHKNWFGDPTWVVSFPSIGIEQVDSKQKFFEPSDVQASPRCVMLIASAASTHTIWPWFHSRCLSRARSF